MIVLLFSAIWVGVIAEHTSLVLTPKYPGWCLVAEIVLLVLLTFEVLLTVFTLRKDLFKGHYRWRCFDVCVWLFHIIEVVTWQVKKPNNYSAFNLVGMSHALRILRLVTLVHNLNSRTFEEIRLMVAAMTGCFKAFVCSIALVFWVIYGVAVYFTEYSLVYRLDDDWNTDEGVATLTRRFGSLQKSFSSLFQAFTGGLDWIELSK